MTRRLLLALASLILAGAAMPGAQAPRSAGAPFTVAEYKKDIEGDLQGAIAEYLKVAETADARVAAEALLRAAEIHEKLGETGAATRLYQRIVNEYAGQPAAALANRVARSTSPSAATLSQRPVMTGPSAAYSSDWSLSADGRYLTMRDGVELAIRDLVTNETRTVELPSEAGRPRLPMLSPDQASLVYTLGSELRLVPTVGGGRPRTLVANAAGLESVSPLAWSLDSSAVLTLFSATGRYLGEPLTAFGSAIAWVSVTVTDDTVKTVQLLPGQPPLESLWSGGGLPVGIDGADLSSDGRYIAYAARLRPDVRDRTIFVVASDGSSEAAAVATAGANGRPKWTPDGKHILFLSDRSGNESLLSIAVENGRQAGLPRVVRRNIGQIVPIGLTRSGSYYYVQLQGVSSNGVNVFVAEYDSTLGRIRSEPTYLTEGLPGWNTGPAYSPDGRFVAFRRRRPDTPSVADLIVRTLASGEERTFAAPAWVNPTYMGAPTTWLHDGSGLLVGAGPLGAASRWLGRLNLADGVFTQVVKVDATLGTAVALSRDDKTVYMLHSSDASYLAVDFTTGTTRSSYRGIVAVQLASGERRNVFMLSEGGTVNSPALSPDGDTLAFFVYEDGPPRTTRLVSVAVDGSGRRDIYVTSKPVANRPDQIQWSRDGRSLLFVEDGRVMRIARDGGTPQYTALAMTRPDRGHPISLSPDGSRIAFSDGAPWSTDREVWALDNVMSVVSTSR